MEDGRDVAPIVGRKPKPTLPIPNDPGAVGGEGDRRNQAAVALERIIS